MNRNEKINLLEETIQAAIEEMLEELEQASDDDDEKFVATYIKNHLKNCGTILSTPDYNTLRWVANYFSHPDDHI